MAENNSIFMDTPVNYYSDSPTKGSITLMAGYPNFDVEPLDKNLCEEISECGFNAVGAVITQDGIASSLERCYENGLKLFVSNGSLIYNTDSFVKSFQDKEGLGGWLVSFKMSQNTLYNDTDIRQAVQKIFEKDFVPGSDLKLQHPIYIGLGGDWQMDINGNPVTSYTKYIREFEQAYKPSIWPMLYMPDLVPSGDTQVPESRLLMYYKSLEYFSYISKFTATPFWAICRCQAVREYYGLDAPAPAINRMRGTVFTALAYGAQGIFYWKYRESPSISETDVNYSQAPVDLNGKKTETWEMVKTINEEVKAYNEVFCGCEMIECRHLSSFEDTGFMKLMTHPIGPLMSISVSGKANLLISHIFNNGKNYLVIVANPFGPTVVSEGLTRLKATFEFNEYWNVSQLILQNGECQKIPVPDNSMVTVLLPGEYFIFQWS